MKKHLVLIGGGQAAAQSIHTARELGFGGRISLVADEPELPYQRPPLSKQYLAGVLPRERLELRPQSFYESRSIELLLGTRATGLDTARRRVTLNDGGELAYTTLILATGGRPRTLRIPGADLDGIHYLRTVADVDAFAPAFVPGRRLVIVGAGYIGLEVAAVAAQHGLDVTVLEATERVLARVVAPEMSAFYERYHRAAGVAIHCTTTVSAFEGTDAVRHVETADGRKFEADLVIVGIGIVPCTELAEAAGLPTDGGILVDEHAQTSAPDIAAAGDCTRQHHPLVGGPLRIESVHNAISQGKAAAHTLVGSPAGFDDIPWFWSDQYDLKLQIAGVALHWDQTVCRGDPQSHQFALYYLNDGVPVAVDCVNSPREFMLGKKMISARKPVAAAILGDVDADLAGLID